MPLDATGYVPSPRVLTPDEARDLAVLKAARHRIRHRWMWCKLNDSLWAAFGMAIFRRSCAMIAIMRVARGDDRFMAAHRLAAQLPSGWTLGEWNDDPFTTHADILGLFDRAIADLELVE
jgi:hypothetical protein